MYIKGNLKIYLLSLIVFDIQYLHYSMDSMKPSACESYSPLPVNYIVCHQLFIFHKRMLLFKQKSYIRGIVFNKNFIFLPFLMFLKSILV